MNRRQFLAASTVVLSAHALSAAPSTKRAATTKAVDLPADLQWHNVRDWGVEGRGFNDTESYFDRLPARAKGAVPDAVWDLARNTAGMSVRFNAVTEAIYVRYTLTSDRMAMAHMPATGVSGVDLYSAAKSDQSSTWRWCATLKPAAQAVIAALITSIPAERRDFHINFPLYNGLKSFEIGLPRASTFAPIAPRKDKPILFYGTSITQGGCASRPGMAFPAILGRRLNRPMLNFGFSGNGRMDVEVARFLAELDPAVFVLDCLANMGQVPVTPSTIDVVRVLREKQPDTPILFLEERPWGDGWIVPQHARNHAQRARDFRAAYDRLIADGVKNLHYMKGDDLIGGDDEGTVDGSHPSDLGMMRYADALEPDLRKLLGG